MLPHRTNVRPRRRAVARPRTGDPDGGAAGRGPPRAACAAAATLLLIGLGPATAWAIPTSTGALARREAGPDERRVMTLDEAYGRTKARSDELRASRERIVQAEVDIARAWALVKPTWSASFNFAHVEPRPPELTLPDFSGVAAKCAPDANGVVSPDCIPAFLAAFRDARNDPKPLFAQDTSTFSTTVNWSVFNGRAIPAIQSAYDQLSAEKERVRAAELDLLLAVARAYYGATAAQQAIAAAERARARTRAELTVAERQLALGETAKPRIVAARVAASQAENDLRRVANLHRQSLLALHFLTRSESDRPDVVLPPEPLRPSGTAPELARRAIEAREDLRAARLALSIAERLESEAWWRFAPTVSVFGAYRYSNVPGLSGQSDQWTFGVLATLLLYDGGLRYADLDAAASRVRAAAAALASMEAKLTSDIERALLQLEGADIAVARAGDAVLLARTRAEVTATQYEAGALRTLELSDANDAVLDAELGLIRASLDRQLGVLELQRQVGAFGP